MKWLVFIFLFSLSSFSNELYGVGKILEVKDEQVQDAMGFKYFVVIKKGQQVGAMPIFIKNKDELKKIADLRDQFVLFRGKTDHKSFENGESTIEAEMVEFTSIKLLDLASLRPVMDNIPEPKKEERSFDLADKGPTKWDLRMDNQVTQSIILTSAALLLNDQMDPGGRGVEPYKDINKGIILTAGILMVADRLSRALKIDFGHWSLKK